MKVASTLVVLLVAMGAARAALPNDSGDGLSFDSSHFTLETVTVEGREVSYRAYEGIVYVGKPVDQTYQRMNIYIPAAYAEGRTVNGYTSDTAPIFMPNGVGGYMPALPGTPEGRAFGGPPRPGNAPSQPKASAIAVALSRGFVVAAPGARGRTLKDESGQNTGKAPAAIVDLKAAVRYIRLNDKAMAGDANKIITNGTSAGGAMSALLGATGDAEEYKPYLTALGAAEASDAVFAASCYCPITNLDHADMAYEWQFNGIDEYSFRGRSGTLSAQQRKLSDELKMGFPSYVNALSLKREDGVALTLDADGNGPFRDEVKSIVAASAQHALDRGTDLASLTWIKVENAKVIDLDFDAYVRFLQRGKTPPAFDALDLGSPENSLFGSATADGRHFTEFSARFGASSAMAEATTVRMMNPMEHIGSEGSKVAKHWRIRHGASDRDTSLAIATALATRLRNAGRLVDFAAPWGVEHSGDYDLDELFSWIEALSRAQP